MCVLIKFIVIPSPPTLPKPLAVFSLLSSCALFKNLVSPLSLYVHRLGHLLEHEQPLRACSQRKLTLLQQPLLANTSSADSIVSPSCICAAVLTSLVLCLMKLQLHGL